MTGTPPPAALPVRLTRSRHDRVVAGVAGGLAAYLSVDPVAVRIAFLVLGFTGSGVLLYLVGWLVMPLGGEEAASAAPPAGSAAAGRLVVGGVLITAGALLLINQLVPWFGRLLVPALLIAVGTAVVVYGIRK